MLVEVLSLRAREIRATLTHLTNANNYFKSEISDLNDLAMNVLEKEARRSKDLADGLQSCDLCQKIPYKSLDLDNNYDHYSSLELSHSAASVK